MNFKKKLKTDSHLTKVQNLFEVYKKRLRAPQKSVVDTCVEVIHDVLNVSISPDRITYSPHSRILRVTTSGMIKTEITVHKKEIITHIQGRLGPQNAPTEIL